MTDPITPDRMEAIRSLVRDLPTPFGHLYQDAVADLLAEVDRLRSAAVDDHIELTHCGDALTRAETEVERLKDTLQATGEECAEVRSEVVRLEEQDGDHRLTHEGVARAIRDAADRLDMLRAIPDLPAELLAVQTELEELADAGMRRARLAEDP